MASILVTGASGFLGRAVCESLSKKHDVVCMSRKNPGLGLPWVKGEFGSFEDLRKLNDRPIDALVHLGAVTGGCTERDAMMVNTEGSRCLVRYLIDRGCKKFVLASSTAAVGFQRIDFKPLQLQMPDEHPCLDRDGYGFSKYMMEEVTRFFHRQNPDLDFINLRLAYVPFDEHIPAPAKVRPITEWTIGGITVMVRSDAVRVFTLAVESARKPGVRILNATGPQAWVGEPVVNILRNWWGNSVDLSHYEKPGHEYDSLYDVSRVKHELGFVAEVLPKR